MGLMRGVLGGETDVAVVVATSSDGLSVPRAILVTPAIADELAMSPGGPSRGVQIGKVGEYAVEVVVDEASGAPLALLMSPWIFENLSLYARKLWWRRRDQSP
jgi:hypothetical protein